MFKFLKEKLKSAISLFSRKAEEEADDIEVKEEVKEKPKREEKKRKPEEIQQKESKKPSKEKPKPKVMAAEIKKAISEEKPEPKPKAPEKEVEERAEEEKKPGFFNRLFGIKPKEEAEKKEVKESREKEEPKAKPKKAKAEEKPEEEKEEELTKEEFEVVKEATEKRHEAEEKAEKAEIETLAKEEVEDGEKQEKKGFFGRIFETITKKRISEQKFDDLFWDLEVAMMENNVAVDVIDKIKGDLKKKVVDVPIDRGKVDQMILSTLKESIKGLFDIPPIDLLKEIKSKKEKPYIISFVGVNGSGKTTTIAKVANMFLKNKLSCVLAASDTFRAASQEQLQEHADKLGVRMIKHDYGADPAAVAFDAIKMARSKGIDVVLIDTAGRLHSNVNLMDELKKVERVAKPDMTIFIGESITGNDCIEQAIKFNEAIDFNAIILTKADVDEKGGAAISVSYVTKKPIIYIGTGQTYADLKKFDPEIILQNLGL